MKYLDFEVNIMKVLVSIVHKHSCASNFTSLQRFAQAGMHAACKKGFLWKPGLW